MGTFASRESKARSAGPEDEDEGDWGEEERRLPSRTTMASLATQFKQFWHHPAGPKTIHFWAPTFKWGISLANVADFSSPVENVSVPQQCGESFATADESRRLAMKC